MTAVQNMSGPIDPTILAPQAQQSTSTSTAADAENRFLTLLVTQLKNQDPLSPMDNAQMTTQLAQISTVDGVEKLNATLQSLAASFAVSQGLQAMGMMGQHALVPGSSLALYNGKAIGGVQLAQPADKVVVTVNDAAGNVLERMDIGAQPAGVAAFTWDGSTADQGSAKDGRYTFTVTATRGNTTVQTTPLAYGLITAVAPSPTGASVTVDGVGSVALSDVKQIVQQ